MESFSLTKNSNFRDIEKAFTVFEVNKKLRLRLPNNLQEKGVFGLEGLVCQLLATWLRNNEGDNILHSYADEPIADAFEDLSSTFYGICALRLADQVLTSSKKIEVPSEIALSKAFERVKKVISGNYKDAYKGLYVAIPSIKSLGASKEYNNPFYNQKEVIGKKGFRKLTDDSLAVVVPQSQRSSFVDGIKGNVSEIVRELFDNTHKHARENEVGDVLPTNFRGVIYNSVDVTPERLSKLVRGGTKGMALFSVEWTKWMVTHKRNLPVLDITIVDAGPGYARRWTGKHKADLTFEEEVEAVVECFEKNKSTSPNDADGSGLTHVLTDLRKLRGWFRLRTGTVAVSRSYFDGVGSVTISNSDVSKAGVFVEGVSFNIVIPLVDIDKEVRRDV